MAALIEAAVTHARQHGARIVEAYPRDPGDDRIDSASGYVGLLEPFLGQSFREVDRRTPKRPFMMIGKYLLGDRPGDPLEIFDLTKAEPGIPTIEFTHDDYPQLKPFDRLFPDKSIYQGKRVVLLVRDPRDVLVSYYFQYTRRGAKERANDAQFDGTISDFIRQDIGALKSIVAFYNIWVCNRTVPKSFHLLRYEALHHEPANELRTLIDFLGLPDFGASARDDAIKFAKFENMEAERIEPGKLRVGHRAPPPKSGGPLNRIGPAAALFVVSASTLCNLPR